MKLGAFSMSLSVEDLLKSKEFYEKLGFSKFGGAEEHHYLIMKNGETIIGLFEGMFEGNILTFNPGWNQECENLNTFEDVRKLHAQLSGKGIVTEQESLEGDSGPGSFVIVDPDGNPILIDQHR